MIFEPGAEPGFCYCNRYFIMLKYFSHKKITFFFFSEEETTWHFAEIVENSCQRALLYAHPAEHRYRGQHHSHRWHQNHSRLRRMLQVSRSREQKTDSRQEIFRTRPVRRSRIRTAHRDSTVRETTNRDLIRTSIISRDLRRRARPLIIWDRI